MLALQKLPTSMSASDTQSFICGITFGIQSLSAIATRLLRCPDQLKKIFIAYSSLLNVIAEQLFETASRLRVNLRLLLHKLLRLLRHPLGQRLFLDDVLLGGNLRTSSVIFIELKIGSAAVIKLRALIFFRRVGPVALRRGTRERPARALSIPAIRRASRRARGEVNAISWVASYSKHWRSQASPSSFSEAVFMSGEFALNRSPRQAAVFDSRWEEARG